MRSESEMIESMKQALKYTKQGALVPVDVPTTKLLLDALRAALAEEEVRRMRSESEMNLREAAQQALEALEEYSPVPTDGPWHKRHHKAITALRAALAEATIKDNLTVEPVAYVTGYSKGYATVQPVDPRLLMCVGMALYRSPYNYKPLTDNQISSVWKTLCSDDFIVFARAIERAHGIGGEE